MLVFSQIKEAARKAYLNGELYEFLTGRNGYDLPVADAPVNVPTDWTRIIPNGIYEIYREDEDSRVIAAYEAAIEKAIHQGEADVWIAVNILYFQLDQENMEKAPFKIDRRILEKLKESLNLHKAYLEATPLHGKQWSMYDDVLRLDRNFTEDWQYALL